MYLPGFYTAPAAPASPRGPGATLCGGGLSPPAALLCGHQLLCDLVYVIVIGLKLLSDLCVALALCEELCDLCFLAVAIFFVCAKLHLVHSAIVTNYVIYEVISHLHCLCDFFDLASCVVQLNHCLALACCSLDYLVHCVLCHD